MLPTTCSSSPSASAPASNSASDRHGVHAVAWADNAHVWFSQTVAQFATKGITCSETKFYYCVAALGRADTAQVVDLIEYPPNDLPNESLMVSGVHVPHLGRKKETLQIDGEDVVLAASVPVPQGSQG